MTIIHASSVLSAVDAGWGDVNLGRVNTGNLCYGNSQDFSTPTPGPDQDAWAGVWLIETGGVMYVRCGVTAQDIEKWYNTVGADQGDPGTYSGTGTSILSLGVVPDSVNIYTQDTEVHQGSGGGSTGMTFVDYGVFTDDDKSTFFDPADATKYGKYAYAHNESSQLVNATEGYTVVQFTFRKAGLDDLTYTFRAYARAEASYEP